MHLAYQSLIKPFHSTQVIDPFTAKFLLIAIGILKAVDMGIRMARITFHGLSLVTIRALEGKILGLDGSEFFGIKHSGISTEAWAHLHGFQNEACLWRFGVEEFVKVLNGMARQNISQGRLVQSFVRVQSLDDGGDFYRVGHRLLDPGRELFLCEEFQVRNVVEISSSVKVGVLVREATFYLCRLWIVSVEVADHSLDDFAAADFEVDDSFLSLLIAKAG